MFRVMRVWVCVLCACAVGGVAARAYAAWPLAFGADVLCGYGEQYATDSGTSVHRGVDLAATAGSEVLAPAAGVVTYAGRVPGSTTDAFCVTVLTADGTSVTCLPLERVSTERDAVVDAGTPLGTVAAAGDVSSAAGHLHISVRAGESYLDPASVLGSPPVAPDPDAEVSGATDEVGAVPGETAGAVAPTTVSPETASDAPEPQLNAAVRDTAEAPAGTIAASAPTARTVATPEAAQSQVLRAVRPASPTPAAAKTRSALAPGERRDGAVIDVRSSRVSNPEVSTVTNRLDRYGESTGKAGLALVSLLGLWPLWRRFRPCSEGVRPVPDHVADAVGRCYTP